MRVGCYPGSFNPPTIAHLAVAEAARDAAGLDRVDLVLSRVALGKEDLARPTVDERAEVLRDVAATRPWLGVVVTDARLIADIAHGYDAVIMGADKWRQVLDPRWYGDAAGSADPDGDGDADALAARDAALARLPRVLVAPRSGDRPDGVELLAVDDDHDQVQASDVRAGAEHARAWMLPEADAYDRRTGVWTGC